jgi:hypothetical protein
MPELTPIPSAQRPSDPGYQPISGYAVAAVITAALCPLFLIALGRSALSYELLIVPIIGVILAAIGRSHIRNSEGTRTGVKMASVAWWVCVLCGAGFAAYVFANQFVVRRETGAFADRFLDELKAGRPHHAFVYLVPAEERDRVSPDSAEAFEMAYGAGYGPFKSNDLVRMMLRNGQDVQYERIAVKDVAQTQEGLQAVHVYRLRCPEGTYEATIRLLATDLRKGGKPQWRIPAMPAPHIALKVERMSQYGLLVAELEQEGDRFANEWFMHMSTGRPALAHLKTTPLAHRRPLEFGMMGLTCVAGGPVLAMPVGTAILPSDRGAARAEGEAKPKAPAAIVPFDELSAIGFFRRDAQNTPIPADKLTKLRELWADPDVKPGAVSRAGQPAAAPPEPVAIKLGSADVTVVVPVELHARGTVYYARGLVGVVCADPELLAKLAELRAKGADAPSDGTISLAKLPPRDWRIVWLATDVEMHSSVSGPPGL